MFLLFVIFQIISTTIPNFFIVSTLNKITTLSNFSSYTLQKHPIKILDIRGYSMACIDSQYGILLTTLIINHSVTDNLYNISHRGVINWVREYNMMQCPIIDIYGNIYGATIINYKFQIVKLGNPDKIKYTIPHTDWLDLIIYDKQFNLFYLLLNETYEKPYISVINNWKIIKNYNTPSHYRIWNIIPHNKVLFILAFNNIINYNQLFTIDLVTNHQTIIATYNIEGIDGVTTSILKNNTIYSIMNTIGTQRQYLVITNTITSRYIIQNISFDDKIICIYF